MITISWATEQFLFEFGVSVGINKEFTRLEDGSVVNEKHTVSIRGSLIADGNSQFDRYQNLINQAYDATAKVSGGNREASLQVGNLKIEGDDGVLLEYESASLLSVSIPEPPENTSGIQFQEINIIFETYITPSDPASVYKLRSVTENFEIEKQESELSFNNNDISEEEPWYSVVVTHTISASGLFNDKVDKREAFEEAYRYVLSRQKESIGAVNVNTDLFTRALFSNFKPKTWSISGAASIVVNTDIESYGEYNKIRSSSVDIPAGSYSLTTKYFLSKNSVNFDLSGEYTRDEAGEAQVSVSGTIKGLSTKASTDLQHNKYINAKAAYGSVAGNLRSGSKIYAYAFSIFGIYQVDSIGVTLRDYPIAATLGENKIDGSIAFNVTYRVAPSAYVALLDGITGAVSATATITDENRSGASYDEQVIVEIPVVGRESAGPIIQNMNTTNSRRRTGTVEVTLEPRYRTPVNELVRTETLAQIDSYAPTGSKIYRVKFSESWDWISGKYSGTFEWTYEA